MLLDEQKIATFRKLFKWKFRLFCQAMWSPDWFDPVFHGRLCDFLQASKSGPKDRLVVMPRSHLKTTIAATLYPLWLASNDPNIRILIISNSSDNAQMTVRSLRQIIDSHPLWRAVYSDLIPDTNSKSVKWTDERASLRRTAIGLPECTFEAAGIGTNIIRRHYDVIIEDDSVAPKKDELSGTELMPSRTEIEKAINFHRLTIPLLVDFDSGQRICIGTRWASYDLINYILENEVEEKGGRFKVLDTPAVDPEGKPSYMRFSLESLGSIKAGLGTFMYNALYLNDPLSTEFMKFRPEWLSYYEEKDLPEDGITIVTIDPADPPTGKSSQDYCAVVSCKHSEKGLYVRTVRRGRFTEMEIINIAIEVAKKDDASIIRIETDRYANMVAAFKVALEKEGQYRTVESVKSKGRSKEARIMRLAPIAENRLLHLRKGMSVLESELFAFPRGTTDDVIDALAYHVDKNFKFRLPKPVEEKVKRPYMTTNLTEIMKTLPCMKPTRLPFPAMLGRRTLASLLN